jgi:hypothetical protein
MKKILASTLLLAVLAVGPPGRASLAVEFEFNGTVHLPVFPCVQGGCVGSFTGVARGIFEDGHAHINPPAPITFSFTYQENNCEVGNAQGSGVIDGIPFTFTWTRTERTVRAVGDYGPHLLRIPAFLPVSVASDPCPFGPPRSVTGNMSGIALGDAEIN